jgi:xanthine dehydrogenase large subunit
MNDSDLDLHSRGQARFVDDLSEPEGLLQAVVLPSPVAHGNIKRLDTEKAMKSAGVRAVLTAADIPGTNQIGTLVADEPLLGENKVDFVGQPVAVVLADSEAAARAALELVELEIEELTPVLDPRRARQLGELIVPPRTFCLGEVEDIWEKCAAVVEGSVESGAQEHLYLETQACMALPGERGGVRVISSTQSPTGVQRVVARILGSAMHQVEVEVSRLGGAFGGKEDQATAWAALAALGAVRCGRPVKLVLHRHEDMVYTGKRHPYCSDYRIGVSGEGKVLAYQVEFYQNAGAAADLSPAILERTLFHCTGSYFVPNVRATAYCCRTNIAPNTAFRGFGGPQGMFVMEAALFKAAAALGVSPAELQEKNLLEEGDTFPYGMTAARCSAPVCWEEAKTRYYYESTRARVEAFNQENALHKKGLALMPVCFGISFTNTVLNQGGALVHVYTDGSVSVSTGAVEMGQGVKYKILEVAARVFSIDGKRIKVESTSTIRVANTSPTAASTGADLNGKATEIACRAILERLKEVAALELEQEDPGKVEIRQQQIFYDGAQTDLNWDRLIPRVYARRINLSAQAHYATPGIHFDKNKEKGEPFSYHAYGTALCEVTVDCLRGTYEVDAVRAVHDLGPSLAPQVDLGQAEGGIVQGIGWLTLEEVLHSEQGRLMTGTLSTYKVPDIHHTPKELEVHFLEDGENPLGLFHSKAIGEPPLMYGIGVFYALLAAIQAFRPESDLHVAAPMTPERVLMSLYADRLGELRGFAGKAGSRKAVSR